MSNLERDYFYLLDWSSTVTDIREQYPLLPQEETLKIAEQCNIKHPRDPKTNHPIVMTTDTNSLWRDRIHSRHKIGIAGE